MAEVARELCAGRGILEPLQTAHSLQGQVEELKGLLEECADLPVTLIGFSWGAWLSFILAARYPAMVKRLVLVGSGPFQEKYAQIIMQTRLSRLSEEEGRQVRSIFAILDGQNNDDSEKNRLLARMGELFSRTDSFDPIDDIKPNECKSTESDYSIMPCHADIYQSVWKEASHLRQTGELLQLGKKNPLPGRCHPRGLGPASSERRQRASAGHLEALSVHSAGGLWAQALDREKGKGQILLHFKRGARLMGCLPLAAGPCSR